MLIMESMIKNVIKRGFEAYIHIFGYAGVAFLLLVVEIIGLAVYYDEALGRVEVTGENTIIQTVMVQSEEEIDGHEMILYKMLLANEGSKRNIVSSVRTEDENGNRISNELLNVYQDTQGWGGVFEGIVIPPGSQTQVEILVDKIPAESREIEKLTFQIGMGADITTCQIDYVE